MHRGGSTSAAGNLVLIMLEYLENVNVFNYEFHQLRAHLLVISEKYQAESALHIVLDLELSKSIPRRKELLGMDNLKLQKRLLGGISTVV